MAFLGRLRLHDYIRLPLQFLIVLRGEWAAVSAFSQT
jgi:hypothetical protein